MRFGSISTIRLSDSVMTEEIEKIHEYQTSSRQVRYTRSVIARSRKDALAECLKLFDTLDLPDTTDINFNCRRAQKSGVYHIEATYTVKDLH